MIGGIYEILSLLCTDRRGYLFCLDTAILSLRESGYTGDVMVITNFSCREFDFLMPLDIDDWLKIAGVKND